ncbi:MAG: response regulator, partial [Candidatus Electrothrix sp. AR3]|nr:response regulator [Candidatus Electrothrix sp. AR3]
RDEYGEPLNMLGVVQDITPNKEAEMKLQAQHRFLDSVIENIPSMLFVKDAENLRFVRFNRAGERLTGRSADDFIGKSAPDLLEEDEAQALLAAERRVLNNSGKIEISEEQISTRHQGTRLVQARKVPILDEQGKAKYLLGICNDITEQKATEKSLAEARVQAEKANQSKSDFLANMSHEIRTPMNGIIGLTELALKTNLDLQQTDYLQKVSQSSRSLLGLLNDILDLSKIEANRLELESIPFDLHNLMAQIDSLTTIHSQQKGIPLHIHIDPVVPQYLKGDPLRIKQILLNLVGNALKFTKEGEICIYIRPGIHAQQGYLPLAFTVEDTGIGISREHQSSLFEAFIQFDSSTTRLHGGTGLGLAITKQLVEMMDGTINLTSEPGLGSIFTFTLPLPTSDQYHLKKYLERTEIQGPDPTELNLIRGAEILLVEDNKINQQVALELLTQEDFKVDLAENGKQALELLERGAYDLILMDLQMPILDGYQTTIEIRKRQEYKKLPILAMSANAMSHDREQCLAVGMNDHIPKPVDCQRLLTALCSWIKPFSQERPLKKRDKQEEKNNPPLPVLPGINSRVALKRLGGNQSFYLNLLRSFSREHLDDVQKIQSLLQKNHLSCAERLAHSLKGMAGAIGAESLQESSRFLEDGLRQKLPCELLLNNTEQELQLIIDVLKKLPTEKTTNPTSSIAQPVTEEQIQKTLRLLQERLENYDAGTLDTLNKLLELVRQDHELYQKIEMLKEPIEQFDFATALSVLTSFSAYGSSNLEE